MLLGRQAIETATWALTIPGLALLAMTGLFMTLRGRLGFLKFRWHSLHVVIGVLIMLNAALVLVPVGGDLLDAASEIAKGSGSRETFAALTGRERTLGPVNLILALVTVFVAVLRPALGQPRA
jgi:hypothetical protein